MVDLRNGGDDTEQSPAVKRRRIRKGTQSCWECKRRKIRCTFATPNESICDGCRSRRVKCIGQEFDDGDVSAAKKTGGISRKETAVGRVSKKGTDLINLQDHGGEDTRQNEMVSLEWCYLSVKLLSDAHIRIPPFRMPSLPPEQIHLGRKAVTMVCVGLSSRCGPRNKT